VKLGRGVNAISSVHCPVLFGLCAPREAKGAACNPGHGTPAGPQSGGSTVTAGATGDGFGSQEFTMSPSGGGLRMVGASGYRIGAGTFRMDVLTDGVEVGRMLRHVNVSASHKQTPVAYIPLSYPPNATHRLRVSAGSNANIDANDLRSAVLIRFPLILVSLAVACPTQEAWRPPLRRPTQIGISATTSEDP
jgi:hypothetical protein